MSPLSYHAFSLEATYFELFPNFVCSNPLFSIFFVYGLMPFFHFYYQKWMNEWILQYKDSSSNNNKTIQVISTSL